MNRLIIFVGIASSLSACTLLFGQSRGTTADNPSGGGFRKVEHNAFNVGEELQYDVNFGFITAGKATMSIPRYEKEWNRQCYYVEFTVRSTGFFDNFYKVRDKYESYVDVEGLFPWKFIQTIREGSYKRDFWATFDHYRLKATTEKGEYPIEPNIQDVLSAFYFMRTYNYDGFRPGQKVYLRNFYKDSVYTLTVKYLGKQTIDVEAGKFRTILLEPIMQEGGLFKASGRIIVWVTDDERKIPVQVDAKIPIGSITSELTSIKGVQGPIKAKVK